MSIQKTNAIGRLLYRRLFDEGQLIVLTKPYGEHVYRELTPEETIQLINCLRATKTLDDHLCEFEDKILNKFD